MSAGRVLTGPFGTATEVVVENDPDPDHQAHIGTWLLDCPGQSPAWSLYMLAAVHLRSFPGESKPATIRVPRATHEFLVLALDPKFDATPDDLPGTWRFLRPVNVCEQVELPDDETAAAVLYKCAQAVVDGVLPAEPMLSGAVEPWRSVLIKTAAHVRGEVHAP